MSDFSDNFFGFLGKMTPSKIDYIICGYAQGAREITATVAVATIFADENSVKFASVN